ncbi:hypothetical protein MMU07_14275 [Aquiflexum sp. LQ15W]|uniref:hypothetical protein n=1 Tax=Cognataquiflexum nitidum TaxID=2922272 RepID=UPI001F12EF1C|nr:hypothetical protein [Cognataquiflexum nitidum]MCH6200748.1 hypothetical protein [Cognataquiflexum nitidum]
MKDTIITLYVNTQKIIALKEKPSKEEVLECIIIGDNHNDAPKTENFVSNIRDKSKLAWVGAAMHIMESVQDFVIITKIVVNKKKSLIKLYDDGKSSGKTHKDGHVGKAKHGAEEEYRIHFLVNSGGLERKFKIDPKIRVI